MRRGQVWIWSTVLMHVLLWAALSAWSYRTAGPYTFASCWSIILIYFPPLGLAYLAVGSASIAVLIASVFQPQLRASKFFPAASHGLVLAAGMQASPLAAYAATGQVACL